MAWWWRDRPGAKQKGRKKRKDVGGEGARERGREGEERKSQQ